MAMPIEVFLICPDFTFNNDSSPSEIPLSSQLLIATFFSSNTPFDKSMQSFPESLIVILEIIKFEKSISRLSLIEFLNCN